MTLHKRYRNQPKRAALLLFAGVMFICTQIPGFAQVEKVKLPRLASVPSELGPAFDERKGKLEGKLRDLNIRRANFKVECRRKSAQDEGCRAKQAELVLAFDEWAQGAKEFNEDLATTQRSGAHITSGEGNRITYDYFRVIGQFDVETNPKYAVVTNDDEEIIATKCNIFAQDVTAAMGAPLPRLLTNQIYDWLNDRKKGGAHGWRGITPQEAQQRANGGYPTIAIWKNPSGHGHIAIIRPGSMGDARGDAEAQSGAAVLDATHITTGFNLDNSKKALQYWCHD